MEHLSRAEYNEMARQVSLKKPQASKEAIESALDLVIFMVRPRAESKLIQKKFIIERQNPQSYSY